MVATGKKLDQEVGGFYLGLKVKDLRKELAGYGPFGPTTTGGGFVSLHGLCKF